jgi:hypothetical protein
VQCLLRQLECHYLAVRRGHRALRDELGLLVLKFSMPLTSITPILSSLNVSKLVSVDGDKSRFLVGKLLIDTRTKYCTT